MLFAKLREVLELVWLVCESHDCVGKGSCEPLEDCKRGSSLIPRKKTWFERQHIAIRSAQSKAQSRKPVFLILWFAGD